MMVEDIFGFAVVNDSQSRTVTLRTRLLGFAEREVGYISEKDYRDQDVGQ